MVQKLFGKKIGMTQIFDENRRVIPVSVIALDKLFVTEIKDGEARVQLGFPRSKFHSEGFDKTWLKRKKNFFAYTREVSYDLAHKPSFTLGQQVSLNDSFLQVNSIVSVSGKTKGKGFQGVVKRWNFAGGPASHGSTFHKAPGSIGNLRTQGEVIKGKRLPGHDGNKNKTVRGLEVIRVDKELGVIFIKGAVPGKKDSAITISKQG